jgi:hypothetical protein
MLAIEHLQFLNLTIVLYSKFRSIMLLLFTIFHFLFLSQPTLNSFKWWVNLFFALLVNFGFNFMILLSLLVLKVLQSFFIVPY